MNLFHQTKFNENVSICRASVVDCVGREWERLRERMTFVVVVFFSLSLAPYRTL